jgi:hypothetical protein
MLDIEPKDFALEIAGSTLDFAERPNPDPLEPPFPAFSIPSLPNFSTFHIESHNAGTVTEEAYFDFMIKTADEVTFGIQEGWSCSFTDGFYTYFFVLIDSPQPDGTGWSLLKANFIEKQYV